ncbi:hypothetical protein [Actinotalea sp. C106]|uniref:hypothetical protein n=1 Tax=Actinotalea sp. C106 TaxID=2908644 RepID=UPI00202871FC|nr:hypothetical protein [Actinotalea sp. C106]
MRWESLFADMEAQLAAADAQDRADEVAELTRAERATVPLADRLRGSRGEELTVTLRSGLLLAGRVEDVGPAWMHLLASGREHLVPLGAVVGLSGLGGAVVSQDGVLRRLGLGHAVRAVARDRSLVRVRTVVGEHLGRVDAVGADHLDVALAYEDSGRPTGRSQVLAFGGLDLISSL